MPSAGGTAATAPAWRQHSSGAAQLTSTTASAVGAGRPQAHHQMLTPPPYQRPTPSPAGATMPGLVSAAAGCIPKPAGTALASGGEDAPAAERLGWPQQGHAPAADHTATSSGCTSVDTPAAAAGGSSVSSNNNIRRLSPHSAQSRNAGGASNGVSSDSGVGRQDTLRRSSGSLGGSGGSEAAGPLCPKPYAARPAVAELGARLASLLSSMDAEVPN
jgi:hypothetical protein